jgi:hypothetical protein
MNINIKTFFKTYTHKIKKIKRCYNKKEMKLNFFKLKKKR